MRKEATKKQWSELYEVALKIKALKPWEHLWDLDTITLLLPEQEPILCSVMGRNAEFYGIGIYKGEQAISNFFAMSEKKNIPPEQMIRYQEDNVLICNFGDREDLTKKEWQLIRDLGLKFRGKNNWLYFRSYQRGFIPYLLDQGEVVEAIEIFKNLYMALRAYLVEGLVVDFENGYTLMRQYSPADGLWFNFAAPIVIPRPQYLVPVLKDEVLLKKINKQKQNQDIWEFDLVFLGLAVEDENFARPINSRMCVILDTESGMLVEYQMLSPLDDYGQIVLDLTIPCLLEYERPQKIIVRDEYLYSLLLDLCEKTEISLEIKEELRAMDSFLQEFKAMFHGK